MDSEKPRDPKITYYADREWLNPLDHPYSASVQAYDGSLIYPDDPTSFREMFIRIQDCAHVIKIHNDPWGTKQDFINKLEKLHIFLGKFINHLKTDDHV